MDLNLVIGGSAGQGLKTLENILSKTFFRMNFNIHSSKDYMSRIRGGHNFIKIRINDEERVMGPKDEEDILLALNEETIKLHKDSLAQDGIIIYDGQSKDENLLSLPAVEIAKEIGNKKVANIVFVGYILKFLGLEIDIATEVLSEYFTKKGEQIKDYNIQALKEGYKRAESNYSLESKGDAEEMLIDGNQAIGLGAIAAGVKFYSAYPMTPATGVMNYIAKKQSETGIVVEQAEDEIAAINMAIGASYSGVRAMTGTSGGGFCLMNEGLGFSGITEIPLVVVNVQRPGPATGLPTRTEQGDLSFVINSSQGEFPLLVTAPRDAKDCFEQSFASFNLAEKYQIPVIILSDQFMADSSLNIPEVEPEELEIESGLMTDEEIEQLDEAYKRYKLTESGISPWAYPGQIPGEVVLADSDEHDQCGNIIEDAETRVKMVDKRAKKMEKLVTEDLLEPLYLGPEEIDYLLLSWGSSYGPTEEARKLLNEADYAVGHLSFNHVWPLPAAKLNQLLAKEVTVISIEGNSTGQFARLVQGETCHQINHQILKYDGRPFSGKEIEERIRKEVIS